MGGIEIRISMGFRSSWSCSPLDGDRRQSEDAGRGKRVLGEKWATYLDRELRATMAGIGIWIDNSDQAPEETVDEIMRRRSRYLDQPHQVSFGSAICAIVGPPGVEQLQHRATAHLLRLPSVSTGSSTCTKMLTPGVRRPDVTADALNRTAYAGRYLTYAHRIVALDTPPEQFPVELHQTLGVFAADLEVDNGAGHRNLLRWVLGR
jgi:hypothetical protein